MHEPVRKASDGDLVPPTERSFGMVFAAFFSLVSAYGFWHGSALAPWWLSAAAAFLVTAYAAPRVLGPANKLWFRLSLLLARVMQPIAIGLIFFAVITPIGLVMRLMGKDLLRLKRDTAAASYWIPRVPPGPSPETMRNQF